MTELKRNAERLSVVSSQSQFSDLIAGSARRAWYYQRHVERWERRYRKPYPHITGVVGEWRGMRIKYDGWVRESINAETEA